MPGKSEEHGVGHVVHLQSKFFDLWVPAKNIQQSPPRPLAAALSIQLHDCSGEHLFDMQRSLVQFSEDSVRNAEHGDLRHQVQGTMFYPARKQVGHCFRVASPPYIDRCIPLEDTTAASGSKIDHHSSQTS